MIAIGGRAPAGAARIDLRRGAPLDDPEALSPDELKRAAEALRGAYLEYVGARAADYGADERWWTGTVAERNPFVSQAFFGLTRVAAAIARIEAAGRPVHVEADADEVAEALAASLEARGHQVDLRTRAARSTFRDLAELVARRVFFAAKFLRRAASARAAGVRRKARSAGADLVVIHEWIDQRNFDAASGTLTPFANFAAVSERLREQARPVATLAFILRTVPYPAALGAAMRRNGVALVPEAFAGVRGLLAIIARSFRRPRRMYPPLNGVVVQPLFDADDRRDWVHHRWVETEMTAAMVRGWRRAGLRIARVIYSFENHTWERVFNRALARDFPEARRIGFQGPALSRFRLNEFMTESEWRSSPVPHRVVTFGPAASAALRESGAPSSILVTGAAPWLQRLLSMPVPSADANAVLVILSIDEAESREVLERAAAALGGRGLTVVVKCHPTMPLERVWGRQSLPDGFRVDTRAIAHLLRDCAVVIYGSSGGALEALGAGAYAVHVRTSRVLDQDPLELWPALHDVAGSTADLARLAGARLSEPVDGRRALQERGRAALAAYLGQDHDAWMETLTA